MRSGLKPKRQTGLPFVCSSSFWEHPLCRGELAAFVVSELNLHHGFRRVRPQCGGKQPVACDRFVWCDATKSLPQSPRALGGIRGPHLEETIREARLKNAARNRCERHLISQIC